jgi:hypothetical protein
VLFKKKILNKLYFVHKTFYRIYHLSFRVFFSQKIIQPFKGLILDLLLLNDGSICYTILLSESAPDSLGLSLPYNYFFELIFNIPRRSYHLSDSLPELLLLFEHFHHTFNDLHQGNHHLEITLS